MHFSEYDKKLLNYAYEHGNEYDNYRCKYLFKNGDDLVHCLNSASALQNSGHIEVFSDQLGKSTLELADNSILSSDMKLDYELTSSGIHAVQNHFR